MIPTTSGVRSPGGVGMNLNGDVFYTDNQGPWNGTCGLKHLIPGKFVGHPGGFKWYGLAKSVLGDAPQTPESGSRTMVEAKKIPELEPSAIWFPYTKMGKSAAGISCDSSKGKFGPFEGQLFVADQSASTVMRCYLEKVKGHYQGVCIPFLSGFKSGSLPVEMTPSGSLFVGGTNRGWGSVGKRPFAVERVDWTGKVPFEIHEMHAKNDGFEFTFTKPLDQASAANLGSYAVKTYTYIYQESYGSPEVDHTEPQITKVQVADDRRSVRVTIDSVQEGHVHEFKLDGIRGEDGNPLLHDLAYYTLNYIPDAE
jgi:hypothetical protein